MLLKKSSKKSIFKILLAISLLNPGLQALTCDFKEDAMFGIISDHSCHQRIRPTNHYRVQPIHHPREVETPAYRVIRIRKIGFFFGSGFLGGGIIGWHLGNEIANFLRSNLIIGSSKDDRIDGTRRNDRIYGGDGNDTINGDRGNDYIFGGRGDDVINGGPGSNVIYGGTGNDRITVNARLKPITFAYGEEGDDIITVLGTTGKLNLDGGSGRDIINFPELNHNEMSFDPQTLTMKGAKGMTVKVNGFEQVNFKDGYVNASDGKFTPWA